MKKNLSLLIFSLILIFLLLESCFRLFYPINTQSYYGEVIDRDQNFIALKKNHIHKVDRWNNEYYASYTFGDYRNRVTQKINNEKRKILILGDSFTFGLYLKDKDTYVNKLQNNFKNFNLVNSSTPGWGLKDYYLFAKKFCKIIKPKKIIIILNDGDLGRIEKKVIKNDTDKISLKEKYKLYKFMIENFMVVSFLRNNLDKFLNNNNNLPKKEFEGTNIQFEPNIAKQIVKDAKKLFIELNKTATNCGASLHVIKLGWNDNKDNQEIIYDPQLIFFKKNSNFFEDNSIYFYDNTLNLLDVHENKQKYIIKNEGHPNELGADEIFNSLKIHFNKILI